MMSDNIIIWDRLIIKPLIIISNVVMYVVKFLFDQAYSFVNYYIHGPSIIDENTYTEEEEELHAEEEDKCEEEIDPDQVIDPHQIRKRGYAIDDLVSSEARYLNQLQMMVDLYQKTLTELISENQIKLFYTNIPSLIQFTQHILSLFIEQQKKGPLNAEIGNIFISLAHNFGVYIPFIERYSEASLELRKLRNENKKVSKYLLEMEENHESFNSLLVTPVQRMPRYLVLLKEILESTPEWHSDHMPLQAALDQMKDISQISDIKVKEAVRRQQLYALQMDLRRCPNLIAPSRTVVGRWSALEPRTEIDLLSDMLIIAKEKTEALTKKKYKVLKLDVNLASVVTVVRSRSKITLQTTGADVVIKVKPTDVEKIADMIEQQMKLTLLAKVSQEN